MKRPTAEIESTIKVLNDQCYDKSLHGENSIGLGFKPFVAKLSGDRQLIEFLGHEVWDSHEDELEGQDVDVSLEKHLRLRANQYTKSISDISL